MGLIDELNLKGQRLRSRLFKPILGVLTAIGLNADNLTTLRIILGVIFLFVAFKDLKIAGIILAIVLFLDLFDGALARYKEQASDKGKFLDMLADYIVYAFAVISCITFLGVSFQLIYHLFIIPVVYLLATIYNSEFKKSDWIIKPYAKSAHLKALFILPFFLYIYTGIEWVTYGLITANIIATVTSIYFYFYIQYRWKKKYDYP